MNRKKLNQFAGEFRIELIHLLVSAGDPFSNASINRTKTGEKDYEKCPKDTFRCSSFLTEDRMGLLPWFQGFYGLKFERCFAVYVRSDWVATTSDYVGPFDDLISSGVASPFDGGKSYNAYLSLNLVSYQMYLR